MDTPSPSALSMVLLTSLLLQSCGNLALHNQHRITGGEPSGTQEQPTTEGTLTETPSPTSQSPAPSTPPMDQSVGPSALAGPPAASEELEGKSKEEEKALQPAKELLPLQSTREAALSLLLDRALSDPQLALEGLEIYKKFILRYEREQARSLLPTVYQKWFTATEDEEVRLATLKTLVLVAKLDPDSTPRILHCLLEATRSKSLTVAIEALHSLGELGKAPEYSANVTSHLLQALNEKRDSIRIATIKVLEGLVKAGVQVPESILKVLIHTVRDRKEREYVRHAAIKWLRKLAQTSTQHRESAFSALFCAAKSRSEHVRLAAIKALGKLARFTAQHGERTLSVLLDATKSRHEDVRLVAIESLEAFMKARPDLSADQV